jgi:nicotinamidase-related amidase
MSVMADSALLIMDIQNAVVERFADASPPLLAALGLAATAARANGIPVVISESMSTLISPKWDTRRGQRHGHQAKDPAPRGLRAPLP